MKILKFKMDQKEKNKEYYEKNKEDILQKRKEYHENNKENRKEYYEKNKEDILQKQKEYYEENKDKIKEYNENNKEKIKEQHKKYAENNKEKIKEYREKNKEKIQEKKKEYHEKNKEKIQEKKKENYENNKEKIKEQNRCDHDKQRRHCIICSPQIACHNCKHMIMSGNKTYRPYCFICYCVKNPDIEIKRQYKTRENFLAEALKEMNLGVDFIQDKRVSEGCSKKRPDFLFDLFTHTVIVECDENGHRDYNTTCEIDKLNATFTDLADRPMVLIRFNPDKYEDKSCFDKDCKLIKNEWNRRIKVLKKEITKAIKEIPEELITIKCLFFD